VNSTMPTFQPAGRCVSSSSRHIRWSQWQVRMADRRGDVQAGLLTHNPFIGIPGDAIENLTIDAINVVCISPHDGDLKKW
jgi:hypothetical protein